MTLSSTGAGEAKRTRLSRAAMIEGYLSLPVVVFGFCLDLLQDWIPESFEPPMGITTWALGWSLAISGVRHAKGWARKTALSSLVILVLHATLILLVIFLGTPGIDF